MGSFAGKSSHPQAAVASSLAFQPLQCSVTESYVLGDPIGSGASATVYLAVHRTLKESRAVKVFQAEPQARQTFLKECSILQKLSHPSLLRFCEAFEDSNQYCIVTEYCEGGEILELVLSGQPLPLSTAVSYFQQVIAGIEYMHSQGIIHGDVKLDNIMLQENTVKLIDFGSAFIQPATQQKLGTLLYAAPEALDNRYEMRSDLWSRGVVFYTLLCGRMPFGGHEEDEIVRCIKSGSASLDGPEWKTVPRKLKNVVKGLLSVAPRRRPSAKKVLRSLERFPRSLHP